MNRFNLIRNRVKYHQKKGRWKKSNQKRLKTRERAEQSRNEHKEIKVAGYTYVLNQQVFTKFQVINI